MNASFSEILRSHDVTPERLYFIDPDKDLSQLRSLEIYHNFLKYFSVPISPEYVYTHCPNLTPAHIEDNIEVIRESILPFDSYPLSMDVTEETVEFFQSLDENSPPVQVQLNLTNRCVNRCQMCRKYEWPQLDMPFPVLERLITELKQIGTTLFILSGGEPFLYRHLKELLTLLSGSVTLFFTSGTVPLTDDIVSSIKKIQFSVDALDPSIYAEIRGPGSIDTIRNNILLAKNAGCEVTITTVIQKANILHVPDIIEFCEKYDIPFYPSVVHSYDALAFYDVSKRIIPDLCVVPFYHCLIDSMGDVFLCCHHHEDNTDYSSIDRSYILGNISNTPFPDVWDSDRSKAIKREIHSKRAGFCKGCYRYLLENDLATVLRSSGENLTFPFRHTYLFPLRILTSSQNTG